MKIAFTHNVQLTASEEEAEFDRPETVHAIARSLQRLGHEVELVEVSGPASRLVARLEAMNPDLIFNTAEGRHGRAREAFYPGLFDQLSLPYTGSDAYVCAVTLDKQLTKMWLANHGVPTPRWLFVDGSTPYDAAALGFPVIVKPNFEGSSKGITQDSVVENETELEAMVAELLASYPTGLLIEEFIDGRDVAVGFLEKASPKTGGVLPPAEYVFTPELLATRKHAIYDFAMKQLDFEGVDIRVPADLPRKVRHDMAEMSRKIFRILGVRDLGRIDYRVTPDGQIFFIEINALPSLEPGAGIYLAAEQAGLKDMDAVLRTVVRSAAERFGIDQHARRTRASRGPLRVGLTYNLKRRSPKYHGDDDSEAEYDAPSTIEAIGNAIASHGHEVIYLEATSELPTLLPASNVDFVFNIAEGIRGRNRESQVPAILELFDIPYTGSDPATLSITLDKALSKRILDQSDVPTPRFFTMRTGKEKIPHGLAFPLILKPVAEGSSKGVMGSNVVESLEALRATAAELIARYRQPMLVEEFLPGREFTVALLGDVRPTVLPPMEIVFTKPDIRNPVYSFEHKLRFTDEIRYDAPAIVDAKLRRELERVARNAFFALGCRDVARIDLRLNAAGKPYFIECNPLPGLTPGWSDLCLIAASAGMDYRTLIGEIMAPTIRRVRQQHKKANGGSSR